MSDNRARCEHCNGTGVFAGKPCGKCGGRGFHFTAEDDENEPPKRRGDRPSRRRP
jgi:DnaJ-class molecular chaperone